MERKVKRTISLKTFFLKFLVQLIVSWIAVILLWTGILEILILSHIMLPANAVENDIRRWLAAIDNSQSFSIEKLPQGVDYACFSKEGELLFGNLEEEVLINAASFAGKETEGAAYLSGREGAEGTAYLSGREGAESAAESPEQTDLLLGRSVYKRIEGNDQILILKYQISAVFSSPSLRRIFPSVEPFLLFFFLLLFLGDTMFFILHYARRLEKELFTLQYASGQIAMRNLAFESPDSSISEVNRVLRSLLVLRDELKNSLKEQWQLQYQKREQLSSLAHDIKTPLTIIKGNAELLAESDLNEEQAEYHSFITENVLQIQRYVTQMLEISKEQSTESVLVPLTQILSGIEKSAAMLCLKKQLTLSVRSKGVPDYLCLPEDPVNRILTNILDNAVQYSPQEGNIILRVCYDEENVPASYDAAGRLTFIITDEGPGFTPAALLHGTEEFYRADESRCGREHFGMGLAIVNRLVQSLNGALELSNAPKGGAVVTVTLFV